MSHRNIGALQSQDGGVTPLVDPRRSQQVISGLQSQMGQYHPDQAFDDRSNNPKKQVKSDLTTHRGAPAVG